MNPRRVHELFLQHCPPIDFSKCDWKHLFPTNCVNETLLRQLLSPLDEQNILVHVQRKVGDCLSIEEAIAFIREHVGKSNIHVFDHDFREWVIVAHNGVATNWTRVDDPA